VDLDFLRSVNIFSDLSENELTNIKDVCTTRNYPKNSMIILEEEMGDVVFIVMTGTVKITRVNDEGKEVILAMLGSGEVFGEMAILDGESRSANALSQENCEVVTINREDFLNIIKTNNKVAINLMTELYDNNEILININEKLAEVKKSYFKIDGGTIKSKISYMDDKGDLIFLSKNILNINNKKKFAKKFQINARKINHVDKIYFNLQKNVDTGKISISEIKLNDIKNQSLLKQKLNINNVQELRSLLKSILYT